MRDFTRYVGIPYKDKGTDPATGLDCWQLVRYFYAQELGVTVPDYMALYDSSLDPISSSGAIVKAIPDWRPREGEPVFGDVLVFRIAKGPWHCAVYVGDGLMLHIDEGHNSVIEKVQSIRWRDRIYGTYRWRS
jgi:cell wall-associated NlpC family hydrolase